MCIGVPMRIESVDGMLAVAVSESAAGAVDRHTLDMLVTGAQPPGTWVLAFHGAARRVLDPDEARRIVDALAALSIALGPDAEAQAPALDALFADLADREPELPEHLRPH